MLTLSSFTHVLITISLIGVVVLIIVVQPYKKASHNTIDSLFILTLAVHTASLTSSSLSVERQHAQSHAALILVVLSGTLPLLYLTVIVLHWVYHCRVFASLCKMCKQSKKVHICCTRERQSRQGRLESSESLPDWMFNPEEYILLEGSFRELGQCEGSKHRGSGLSLSDTTL